MSQKRRAGNSSASKRKQGKRSAAKRDKARRANATLGSVLRSEELDSLLPLLEAGSISPAAAHRLPSIAVLFEAAMKRRSDGTNPVSAADLQPLLAGVRRAHPQVVSMEDFAPLDLRLEVEVPWFGELYTLAPGALERPVAVVDQYRLLADAIDPVLLARLGFGLQDVGEVILRRVDQVVRAARAVWTIEDLPNPGDPAVVSDPEVAAVAAIDGGTDPDTIASQCTHPERARQAIDTFTAVPSDLDADGDKFGAPATFGVALAVTRNGQLRFLPAGLLVEAFLAIGAHLAAEAVSINPRATIAFWRIISRRIAAGLSGAGTRVLGPVDVGAGRLVHSLVLFGDRQLVALDVVPGLSPADLRAHMPADGADPLDKIVPGATVTVNGYPFTIRSDAVVAYARVLAVPLGTGGMVSGDGPPVLTLADLEWFTHTSRESPEDVWAFLLALTQPEQFRSFGWDMIDRWEVWKPQRSFLRSGIAPTFMMFTAHSAVVEWQDAAKAAPVERALHRLGMREIRAWPARMTEEPGVADLLDLNSDEAWTVLAEPFPVAINRSDLSGSRTDSDTLWHVATSVAWKIKHTADVLSQAASASNVESLVIRFRRVQRDSPNTAYSTSSISPGPPGSDTTIAEVLTPAADDDDATQLTIEWDERLPLVLAADAGGGEARLGELLASKFTSTVRDAIIDAWTSAPPGLRMDGYSVRQRIAQLPKPDPPSLVARSTVLRELAEHVAQQGFTPGMLHGPDARDFESKIVFPWLLERLHQHLTDLNPEELVAYGSAQLERAHHQRSMEDLKLGWRLGFPQTSPADVADVRDEASKLTRAISLLREEVLANPPTGTANTDSLTWGQALATAELCIESCMRSAALHYRLEDTFIEVSDSYDINVNYPQAPTDIDFTAYQAQRALATRPAAVPIATPSLTPEDPEADPNDHTESVDTDGGDESTIIDRLPDLAGIDQELRATLGFGIDAMMGVLNVGAQWADAAPTSATLTDAATIVAECFDLVIGNGTDAEYAVALNWLTLRGSDLTTQAATTGGVIAHWETDRRAKRLLTSPFVETPRGLWVLPWACEMAMRVAVTYLHDGRLPWPNNSLPDRLVKALDAYRQQRNRQLEIDSAKQLADLGFTVRHSVKKPKVIGLKTLSGEIDVLCVDAERSRIWVIEAKDPYVAFSAPQLRRLIDDFHKPKQYLDKLAKKVDDVRSHASAVAAALTVPEPDRSWEIVGLMVTRHVEAAAFAVNPRVTFCTVDTLAEAVDRDELPALGWLEPAAGRVGGDG
ncbi:hypothetical protein BH10ACT8_BH10ACT8_04600 [soil metagenome]